MRRTRDGLTDDDARSRWVRLRTLILLRWMAIAGQSAAVLAAWAAFGLDLPLGACALVIAMAVLANLAAMLPAPRNHRLSESEAMLTLLFDMSQLALLLYVTGGITNPFAVLILAPVTISAAALRLRSTLILGGAAAGIVTVLSFFYVPLRYDTGEILVVSPIMMFGHWLAIVIAVMFFGLYLRRVANEIHQMSDALLATQSAMAREQALSDLGGVVAAAAHELGTPLATIKLASAELVEELGDRPDLREDAELIVGQADRCRDILHSMGRSGKEDLLTQQAPLGAMLREAAEPHADRGRQILFDIAPAPGGVDRQPQVQRRPEIVHGLRNMIQNAVDFARTTVWIDARWTREWITIRILDDGPGFPPSVLGRIGDPFVRLRKRQREQPARPGYEGMGLGLFIAKTLLERTGADVSFANATDPEPWPRFLRRRKALDHAGAGAIVEVIWPADRVLAPSETALGTNRRITR